MSGRTLPEPLGYLLLAFLLVAPGFAADATTTLPHAISPFALEHERRCLEERFAVERLAFWQKKLNLQDWGITLTVARAKDLRPDTLGNVHWDTAKKTAQIRVLDAADYSMPLADILRDVETTIVHELVHLELSSIPRNEASLSPEEKAVVRISEALLKLHRNE